MFCKYCGNQIDDDAVFCSSCGKKVADANVKVNAQSVAQNAQETSQNATVSETVSPSATENIAQGTPGTTLQENEQTVNETTQQEPVTQVTNETQQQETQSNTTQTDAQQPKQYNDAATAQLFDAVKSRSVDKVKQLIADGANVNIIDQDGWTPLMFASYCTLEMVQVLLAAGAIVDVKSKVGQTALSLAQSNRTSDKNAIIELLQQYENGNVQSAQEQAKNTVYTEINQAQAASVNTSQTTQQTASTATQQQYSTTTSISEDGKVNTTVNITMAGGTSVARAADPNASPKSRTVCLLLAIFLGWCGAHRFYAGKIGTAILKIVLCFFCFLPGFVYVVGIGAFVWAVIDLIMVACGKFTDKDGKLITVWE